MTLDVACPEALIPVPLHWRRHFKRGFNQSLMLANGLSRVKQVPCYHRALIRQAATRPQSSLAFKQRKSNVKGAFKVKSLPNLSHVAIIDDVLTTGMTANELAKVLKLSGVIRVDVWCLCRA